MVEIIIGIVFTGAKLGILSKGFHFSVIYDLMGSNCSFYLVNGKNSEIHGFCGTRGTRSNLAPV